MSKPIAIGAKGKGVDWEPLKQHMQKFLGYVPSLSQQLTRDELKKMGFMAACQSYEIP